MAKKNILLLYHIRNEYPLRSAIASHLYCWKRYSKHNIIHVNVAFGFPARLLKRIRIDAILFHTKFLGTRWDPVLFRECMRRCASLKELRCPKIALPQDEFINTEILNEFINEFGISRVLSCASEPDWPVIYDRVDRGSVRFETVLTGYVDPDAVKRIEQLKLSTGARNIDIGYRAWRAEYWLGEHGQHKVKAAEILGQLARERGLSTDISLEARDILAGDSWFEFLLRCRATVGVEGGASVLDRSGQIKHRVDRYLERRPEANFAEVRAACFPLEEGTIKLACISPRHLEACATETLQFLVEGQYNGVLKAGRHYIPLKNDYANAGEALDILSDHDRVKTMTTAAYREIACAERWAYPTWVREIEHSIFEGAARQPDVHPRYIQYLCIRAIILADILCWLLIRLEVLFLSNPRVRAAAKRVFRYLQPDRG